MWQIIIIRAQNIFEQSMHISLEIKALINSEWSEEWFTLRNKLSTTIPVMFLEQLIAFRIRAPGNKWSVVFQGQEKKCLLCSEKILFSALNNLALLQQLLYSKEQKGEYARIAKG